MRRGTWGHVGRGCGDIKYRNAGDVGTLMILAKVEGKCDITRLQGLTEGDAICREMKNEKLNNKFKISIFQITCGKNKN